ncbi:MAG: DUF6785 family protein [Capsulimonadales bacterium]|nr:DUF6785 family protein [Capsulimonadales bacterium]
MQVSDDAHSAGRLRPWVVYGLGTLLLLANAWFGTYAYVVVQALLWTQTALQRGPVVFLFALVFLNFPFLRWARRFSLSTGELLILYSMIAIGTCAGGYGFVQILINHMAAPFYYASGSNGYADRLHPHVPWYVSPRESGVLNGFFRGNSSLYRPEHLLGWSVPVLFWSGFIITIFLTLLCLASVFRKQWVESERLTFPLVLLPLEMAGDGGGNRAFWRNPWMWAGFILAGVLESLNFLNFLFPSVPSLPIKPGMGQNEIGSWFGSRPLNAMGRLTLSFYPFAIGIGYLLALDVSFSSWFLYLASKAALVGCAALGLSDGATGSPSARMPYLREQGLGAFLGIALFSVVMARKSLAAAWASVRHPRPEDRYEMVAPGRALVWAGIGLIVQAMFLMAIGLSTFQAILFVSVYTCFSLTLARIVSEVGAGWAWAPMWSPTSFVAESIGPNHLPAKETVAIFGYTSWTSDMRDNPWPQASQSLKMASSAFSPRQLFVPLVFATVIGVVAAFWAHLDIYYTYGAATAKVRPALANGSQGPFRQAITSMITPTLQDWSGLGGATFGGVTAVGLSLVRQRMTGFVLHPLGYAMAMTNTMEYMWCPFLIAWGAKAITLRYGGIGAYRAALPFFLGLILGDYVVPTLWGVFGMVTDTQMYMVFPH